MTAEIYDIGEQLTGSTSALWTGFIGISVCFLKKGLGIEARKRRNDPFGPTETD
jgi:hypothetical protein